MSDPNTQTSSVEEFLAQGNDEIILGCNNSQQRSLAVLSRVGQQLQQAMQVISHKDEQIKNFDEFCKKNKIDYPPKPVAKSPPKENKIVPTVK